MRNETTYSHKKLCSGSSENPQTVWKKIQSLRCRHGCFQAFASSFLIATLALALCGCATHPLTERSEYVNGGITNVVYSPAAWLTNAIGQVQTVNRTIPANPASPILDLVLTAALAGLGLFARYKTQQAKLQGQAADLLAATVVSTGKAADALKVSSGTSAHQTVAQHIDNNTL